MLKKKRGKLPCEHRRLRVKERTVAKCGQRFFKYFHVFSSFGLVRLRISFVPVPTGPPRQPTPPARQSTSTGIAGFRVQHS